MAAYFRLQDLIKVSGSSTQDKRDAIDVGNHRFVVIQTRVPVQASTSGTLYFQHAAVREEEAFVDFDPGNISIDLTSGSNVVVVIQDPLRFLRWRVDNVSAEAKFLADAIAR